MTYIIPDIHGHLWEFDALLDKIGLGKDDRLFLLGDYIDRGPESREVVDRIMELKEKGYRCTALRGNHEQMFLDSSDRLEEFAPMSNKRKKPFCDEQERVIPRYRTFFESLPVFVETEDLFLAHAGINFRTEHPFEDTKSMLWMREIRYVPDDFKKTIVHGHNPMSIGVIRKMIEDNAQVIPLDNGIYMKQHREFGQLLCLEWETRELYAVNHREL